MVYWSIYLFIIIYQKYYMHYKNLVLSACLRCSLKIKLIIMFCVFIFKLVLFGIIKKYAFFILKLSLSTLLPFPSSLLRLPLFPPPPPPPFSPATLFPHKRPVLFCWTNPFAYSAFAATTARTSPMYWSW